MSTEQQETLDAILRQSAFPVDSDVNEQRELLRQAISAQPLPVDVTVTAAAPTTEGSASAQVNLPAAANPFPARDRERGPLERAE